VNNTDICYLTLPLPSIDQAVSFAAYLNHHGYDAAAELNEVTCPLVDDPALGAADIYQLRRNWDKWWANSDSELFGLPVFVRTEECHECHQ